jgi:hypothetical protein
MLLQKNILIDERAADALPMRFTAASIVLLILVLLSATSISSLLEEKQVQDCEAVLIRIDSNAKMMTSNGAGSKITLDVDIPGKTTIILGSIPTREAFWPEDSNNYWIMTKNREVIGESLASYSNADFNGDVTLSPGSHILTLESVKRPTDNRIFVKVYEI